MAFPPVTGRREAEPTGSPTAGVIRYQIPRAYFAPINSLESQVEMPANERCHAAKET